MIRDPICALLFLILPASAAGQQGNGKFKTDSVTTIDASRSAVDLINEANSVAISSPIKSNQLATAALEKSIAENDKGSQYRSYITLGTLYYNAANYVAAVRYFEMASAGFETLKDGKNKAYSDRYLSMARNKLKDLKGYEISKKKMGPKITKNSSVKKEEELKYRADRSANTADQIDVYKELGEYYLENKDTAQAMGYLNKVATWSYTAPDSVMFTNVNSLNKLYTNSGSYTSNINFQQNAIVEGRKRGNENIVGLASYNLGTTYNTVQQSELAIPFLKESIAIANKEQDIDQKQKSVKELARAYENLGQYDKALTVIKDYIHTLDSLQNMHDQNMEASLTLNKEFAKQESRIQKLIVSQKQKEADFKKQRNILWSLAAVLVLFGLLTWLLVRNIRQKQKANMQIKLQSLRAQMNPHFIFNSLNSVNNFISKNDERSANRYLSDFSTLMRTVLKNSDQDFVALETEIQTLRIYLDLEHFRFGEKFDYSLEIAEDIDPNLVQVPPMLIQPYIENAIWHGLRYKEDKGRLEVKFYTENEKLYCTVKDNGIGREKSAALKTSNQKTYQSTGIKNTKDRIELLNKLHGTKLHISIFDLQENGTSSGTMARISIPYIMQLEEI
jgi:two-component system LytT family sensor kinase